MLRDEEIDRLREVAAADPTQTVRLCDLLIATGRAEEAVRVCRSALRDRPDDVDLRLGLGRALSASGNLEEAQAALFDAVVRKRRITRQNIPIPGAQATPPQSAPSPLPEDAEPNAPRAVLSGGTSRHILAPPAAPRGPEEPPANLRPLAPTSGEGPGPPPSAPRKLPPVGPPSQRLFAPLPRAAPRFPLSGRPASGGPTSGPFDRPRLPIDDVEAAPPVPDLITEELTGSMGLERTPSPARRPDSAITPSPARRPDSAITPSPARRPDSAITPSPRRLDSAASGRPALSGAPPLLPPAELPAELREPVLPLPELPSLSESRDGDEPSLVSEVLAAASGAPAPEAPRRAPPSLSTESAAPSASPAKGLTLPIDEADEPPPSADLPAPSSLAVDLSPQALLFDIEGAAQQLLGADRLPQKAPRAAEQDRSQLLFDRERRRTFSRLWTSLVLVSIGVIVGWATRTVTTKTALQHRLGQASQLAATARYDDLRAARDLYLQAVGLVPHDPLSLALAAEAEARLAADHGEGTDDAAFILLGRARREARPGPLSGPLRRAYDLLALARGEPCPVLGAEEEAQREDGDVAARCALQRGDVPVSLRILTSGAPGSIDQLLWRGALALSLGDLDEADHAYRTVLDLLPGHPRALLGRGAVLAERGQDPAVPPLWQGDGGAQSLGLVGEAWWHLLFAISAQRRGDEAQVAEALSKAQRGARYDARLALWVGRAHLDEGRVALAEASLRQAQRLSPSDPGLVVLDAEVALAKGHEDRVIRALPLRAAPGEKRSGRLLSVLGRAQYRAGHYREASETLERALAGRPGDVVSRSYRLLCRARLGSEREAFRELEQLAAGPQSVTTPHYALAVLSYERKDLERAAAEALLSLQRNPEASYARALRGRVLREQGKLVEAIAELERARRDAPALLLAHQLLGRLYLDLGRIREARLALRQAVDSGRGSVEDYAALLDATLLLSLPVEAEQIAREARRAGISPGRLRRAELLASVTKGPAQAAAAARELESERRANSRDVQLGLLTAGAWLRAGDGQAALDVYQSLRGRAPLLALLGVGRAQLRLHNAALAEAAFRGALAEWERAPYAPQDRTEARGGLCRALLLRGASQEAEGEATAALAEAPDSADGHFCRAKLLNARGQLPAALVSAARAVELDPENMDGCVLLGDLTYKSKQPDLARTRYERCLELSPNSQLGRYVRSALSMIK